LELFPYKQYNIPADTPPENAFPVRYTLYLPIIEIRLRKNSNATKDTAVLIDSGATHCIFSDKLATILGIGNITNGLLKKINTAGSGSVDAYFFDIYLEIKNITVSCYAGFIKGSFPLASGVLGGYDFLNSLRVALNSPAGEIEIG